MRAISSGTTVSDRLSHAFAAQAEASMARIGVPINPMPALADQQARLHVIAQAGYSLQAGSVSVARQ
jgi:hypothetical protein